MSALVGRIGRLFAILMSIKFGVCKGSRTNNMPGSESSRVVLGINGDE